MFDYLASLTDNSKGNKRLGSFPSSGETLKKISQNFGFWRKKMYPVNGFKKQSNNYTNLFGPIGS